MKLGLILAGFVVLAVAALTGWTRHAGAAPANPAPVASAVEAPCVAPATTSAASPPVAQSQDVEPYTSAGPVVYATLPFGSSPAYEPAYADAPPQPQYVETPVGSQQRVVRHEYVPAPRRTRVYYYTRRRHHRPFSHSAVIVGGSAAAGAGIGALAGGGRGAGIGALAGGAGGLIYDRLTH